MIASIFLSREEFAARRRKSQDDAVRLLSEAVRASILGGAITPTLARQMLRVFSAAYRTDHGEPWGKPLPEAVTTEVEELLSHTTGQSNVGATTMAIVNILLNMATIQAAIDDEDDVFLEWVTMHDGNVRRPHADTDGQIRPVGEKFDVDGVEMSRPGDLTTPIELWINCRCVLRPTFETAAQVTKGMDFTTKVNPFASSVVHTGTTGITPYAIATQPTQPWITTTTSTGISMMTTHIKEPEVDDSLARLAEMDPEQQAAFETLVPWHGVLAPEGVASGDGRKFAPDALTFRDLPLPLTYQKEQGSGHDGSVVVGSIESIERKDGLMLASGYMLSTAEADELIGLMAHFGKYGVSVDADSAEFDFDEEANEVTFTSARICSASAVSIPAFAEAYIALGPWSEDEALVADGNIYTDEFKDLAPGKTEDGPGWLTNPVDTERLRHYWVHGPGAAKIGWGSPGDFNRCRLNLAKYVKPQYLSGYCANRHYDALGFWPGRPVSGETIPFTPAEGAVAAAALTLVASAKEIEAPADWFTDPGLDEVTHLTVTKEGRVFGHVAAWGTCHIGMQGVCVDPPRSSTNYGHFANKAVLLDNGEFARTGVITYGGTHAPGALGLRSASKHYDQSCMGACDVAIGEDEFGIWVAGWVRPGTTPETIAAIRASDVSGDWRALDPYGQQMELVGVLAVNTGGFNIKVAASSQGMLSLVAAGMVEEPQSTEAHGLDVDALAEAMAVAIDRANQTAKKRAATMATLRKKFEEV